MNTPPSCARGLSCKTGHAYQCVGMPMGWSHAPGMFTDLLCPVVREIRTPGWRRRAQTGAPGRALWYIDDFLLMGETAIEAAALRDRTAELFSRLGLAMNPKKCQWQPVQALLHLGLVIDTRSGHFRIHTCRTVGGQCSRQARGSSPKTWCKYVSLAGGRRTLLRSANTISTPRTRATNTPCSSLAGFGTARLGTPRIPATRMALRAARATHPPIPG